jgi:hypothetical protein
MANFNPAQRRNGGLEALWKVSRADRRILNRIRPINLGIVLQFRDVIQPMFLAKHLKVYIATPNSDSRL